MTARGFALETVFCGMCNEATEAIPQSHNPAEGLPEGWVVVIIGTYGKRGIYGGSGPTNSYGDRRHVYFCSVAHLPSELLPPEGK